MLICSEQHPRAVDRQWVVEFSLDDLKWGWLVITWEISQSCRSQFSMMIWSLLGLPSWLLTLHLPTSIYEVVPFPRLPASSDIAYAHALLSFWSVGSSNFCMLISLPDCVHFHLWLPASCHFYCAFPPAPSGALVPPAPELGKAVHSI